MPCYAMENNIRKDDLCSILIYLSEVYACRALCCFTAIWYMFVQSPLENGSINFWISVHDVTAAIILPLNKDIAVTIVSQTNPF